MQSFAMRKFYDIVINRNPANRSDKLSPLDVDISEQNPFAFFLGRVYTINMGYLGKQVVKLGCIQSLQKYIFSSQNHVF